MLRSIKIPGGSITTTVIIYDLAMILLAEAIKQINPSNSVGIILLFPILGSALIITLLGIGAILQPRGDKS